MSVKDQDWLSVKEYSTGLQDKGKLLYLAGKGLNNQAPALSASTPISILKASAVEWCLLIP